MLSTTLFADVLVLALRCFGLACSSIPFVARVLTVKIQLGLLLCFPRVSGTNGIKPIQSEIFKHYVVSELQVMSLTNLNSNCLIKVYNI